MKRQSVYIFLLGILISFNACQEQEEEPAVTKEEVQAFIKSASEVTRQKLQTMVEAHNARYATPSEGFNQAEPSEGKPTGEPEAPNYAEPSSGFTNESSVNQGDEVDSQEELENRLYPTSDAFTLNGEQYQLDYATCMTMPFNSLNATGDTDSLSLPTDIRATIYLGIQGTVADREREMGTMVYIVVFNENPQGSYPMVTPMDEPTEESMTNVLRNKAFIFATMEGENAGFWMSIDGQLSYSGGQIATSSIKMVNAFGGEEMQTFDFEFNGTCP